jgi:hypothetical protein
MNGPQRLDYLFDGTILGVLRDSAPLMELSTDQSNSRYENSCNSYPEFRIHGETVLATGYGFCALPTAPAHRRQMARQNAHRTVASKDPLSRLEAMPVLGLSMLVIPASPQTLLRPINMSHTRDSQQKRTKDRPARVRAFQGIEIWPVKKASKPTTNVVRVHDIRSSYLLNLRALGLASERVKEACQGNDIDAAAVEAHFALHAVYDLHEAYFVPRGVPSRRDQDDVYSQEDGQVVAGLVLARGTRTHQLVTFPTPGGFPTNRMGWVPTAPVGSGRITLGLTTATQDGLHGMRSASVATPMVTAR